MNINEFDFDLPEKLIAHHPATPRDSSRMLIIGGALREQKFSELPSLLTKDDLLVFNNSKVIPARLFAEKNGRVFEILLHKKLQHGAWQAFIRGAKKLKAGDALSLGGSIITVTEKLPSGEIALQFSDESVIAKHGHMPLPPYIKREDTAADATTYQTVYAQTEGSVAAPTAGLHFTPGLMEKLPNKAFVTLHVGAGTFQPVKVEDISEHKMHSEFYEIPPETEAAIKNCKGRIIAVGTTSLRVLEASGGVAGSGDTEIFITPGYKFKVASALITNFHLPKSTLFILTCAMAGTAQMRAAYAHAIANNFRFYSYGDACFIENRA